MKYEEFISKFVQSDAQSIYLVNGKHGFRFQKFDISDGVKGILAFESDAEVASKYHLGVGCGNVTVEGYIDKNGNLRCPGGKLVYCMENKETIQKRSFTLFAGENMIREIAKLMDETPIPEEVQNAEFTEQELQAAAKTGAYEYVAMDIMRRYLYNHPDSLIEYLKDPENWAKNAAATWLQEPSVKEGETGLIWLQKKLVLDQKVKAETAK